MAHIPDPANSFHAMMQRRKFIQLAAISSAGIVVTGIGCSHRQPALYNLLEKPEELSQICDLKTLKDIGMVYRLQTPSEREAIKLVAILSADATGKTVSPDADPKIIQDMLHEKIQQDFETDHTVILLGWVLSVTEARQCALLFVNHP